MQEPFCPICKTQLERCQLEWSDMWTFRQTFRCPVCATMLAWNHERALRPTFLLFLALFIPAVIYYVPEDISLLEEISRYDAIILVCGIVSGAVFACLFPLFPAKAEKFSDE